MHPILFPFHLDMDFTNKLEAKLQVKLCSQSTSKHDRSLSLLACHLRSRGHKFARCAAMLILWKCAEQ